MTQSLSSPRGLLTFDAVAVIPLELLLSSGTVKAFTPAGNEETNTTLSCAPLLGCFIMTVSQLHLLYTCSLYLMSGRGIHKDGEGLASQ